MFDRVKKFWKNLYEMMNKPEMLTLPSSLAYYFVLSIVPIISILLIIASNFNLSINFITEFLENNFSKDLVDMVMPIVTNKDYSIGFIVYFLVAFFMASNGSDAIIVASNTIFNIKNESIVRRRIKAFVLTLVLFLLFTFMLIVPVFGEQILSIATHMGFNSNIVLFIQKVYPILNIPLSLTVMYLGIKCMFIIAPDQNIKGKYVNKGAVFTTVGWFLATIIYSYYVKNIASYNVYYAGLSTIVMLMVWFYFLAVIFVVGLSMNYQNTEEEIERTNAIKLKEIEEKVKASKFKK